MPETSLYREMAKLIGAPESKIIPRILQMIADEREIQILQAAFPAATAEELSAKTGIPENEAESLVKGMFAKGLLFLSKKEGAARYYRVKTVPQFHDSSVLWPGASREFLDLWKEYTEKEWGDFGRVIEAFLPKPAIRVIPVRAAIESKAKVLAMDDVRHIIGKAKTLAVTPCTCRTVDGKCGKAVEVCIQVNRAAEYALQRGTGRALTPEEAIGLLRLAEKEGLVHIVDNHQTVDHIICNCCSDCCINWRLPNFHKFVAPSRFRAQVAAEECIGCQSCLERCYFSAIKMEGDEPRARIEEAKCMGCGLCSVTCPTEAILLKEIQPPESVPV
jgi:ferredoxin